MTDLHDLTAAQLLERFASRQLSPIDYYDHLLAHTHPHPHTPPSAIH